MFQFEGRLSGMDMGNLYLKFITSYYRGLHPVVNADFGLLGLG